MADTVTGLFARQPKAVPPDTEDDDEVENEECDLSGHVRSASLSLDPEHPRDVGGDNGAEHDEKSPEGEPGGRHR